ncbi:MAG: hypothetical protein SFY81_03155 [Verrucomicrobiota bacterium]|nr:hypothetical protein [Verrucomicrobiota bacterium]
MKDSVDPIEGVAGKIQEGIEQQRWTWNEIREELTSRTREAAIATDSYVHEKPWKAIGIAAMLGFIAGMILAPRGNDEAFPD